MICDIFERTDEDGSGELEVLFVSVPAVTTLHLRPYLIVIS